MRAKIANFSCWSFQSAENGTRQNWMGPRPGDRLGAGAWGATWAGWAEGGVTNRCWSDSAVVTSLR